MADAWEDKLSDAIVLELKGISRPWHELFVSECCTPFATRCPWYEDGELEKLKVAVFPIAIENGLLAREAKQKFDYGIGIDFQRYVEPTSPDPAEAERFMRQLSKAAEEVHDWFRRPHKLEGIDGWIVLEAVRKNVYNIPLLYSERIWETYIGVTVRGHQP